MKKSSIFLLILLLGCSKDHITPSAPDTRTQEQKQADIVLSWLRDQPLVYPSIWSGPWDNNPVMLRYDRPKADMPLDSASFRSDSLLPFINSCMRATLVFDYRVMVRAWKDSFPYIYYFYFNSNDFKY